MKLTPLVVAALALSGVAASCAPAGSPLGAPKSVPARRFVAAISPDGAAMRVRPLLEANSLRDAAFLGTPGDWQKWGEGYALHPGEGRAGATSVFIERTAASDGERGIWQEVPLDQKQARPVVMSGWSRSEGVSGSPDSDYSLYADLTFQDGTTQWGQSAPFATGTHDWQRARHVITPDKPIKSLRFYALFRGHTGRVWFSDLRVGSVGPPPGFALFDSLAVQSGAKSPVSAGGTTYSTRDGLALGMSGARVSALRVGGRDLFAGAASGFLARDVANGSDFHPLALGPNPKLRLQLDAHITPAADHITIEGRVADLSGRDRAISLVFALPLDARGWQWGQTIREAASVGDEELSNTVDIFSGANGRHSLYPLANINDARSGLAIALDPDFAAQNRLAVNGATRQFYLVYDFGLTPEKSDARFRFVLYRTDPKWGFRSALAKLSALFPESFRVRGEAKLQGLWMPFSDVAQVQGWQDFGFRFREANDAIASDPTLRWDDEHGILSFRYHEPMTWWMNIPKEEPHTEENALADLEKFAADPTKAGDPARAVLSSGFRDAQGHLAFSFRDAPWASGAVWGINPDPQLPGAITGASLNWSPAARAAYINNPHGVLDGEYLDSLEGYVTADLNFDRAAFRVARAPLTFDTATSAPAQHKGLLIYDYTRWETRDVHALGKLMFANSVPNRFTFLAPFLDVMGTETDWLPDGKWAPDSDTLMSLRRALSGPKPYLLLQNTNFDQFTPPYVEKYMQRALFYGMFPGFFSGDAATKPYWENPAWYNRDRPLFQKYLPIIRPVAQAGWQAITLARSDNPSIWLERFGTPGGPVFLTLFNPTARPQTARIALEKPLRTPAQLRDLVSGRAARVSNDAIEVSLGSEGCAVLRLG